MDYKIIINLSLLNNAIETEVEIGDSMEKGIFIPYRYAPIYKRKKAYFCIYLQKKEEQMLSGSLITSDLIVIN